MRAVARRIADDGAAARYSATCFRVSAHTATKAFCHSESSRLVYPDKVSAGAGNSLCTIEVSAVILENEWCFLIKDTGQGIKHEDLGRIFERFYRGDKSRSQEGTGLGLSIVKEYVDSLSGMLDVTSVPNAWTEFMVTLPEFSENKVSEVEK